MSPAEVGATYSTDDAQWQAIGMIEGALLLLLALLLGLVTWLLIERYRNRRAEDRLVEAAEKRWRADHEVPARLARKPRPVETRSDPVPGVRPADEWRPAAKRKRPG